VIAAPARTQSRRLVLSPSAIAVVVVAAGGLALRVWVHRSALGTPDADEAVWGLMARHVLDGELTTFVWGSPYGGTQEVLLTAPVFWLFGTSLLALRVVPIVLSALAAVLVWRVGRRTIGEPRAAVAGLLFWIWPPFTLFESMHAYGFYATNIFYCALILLAALRAVERPDHLRLAVLGLCIGLATWQTVQIVTIALPALAWGVWKAPAILRRLWVVAGAFVLGVLPSLVWNALHGWGSFTGHGRADAATYGHALRLLVSPLMPMMLGLRAPRTAQLIAPHLVVTLIYAGLLVLFAVGAVRTRRENTSLLYVVALVFPFVWALASRVEALTWEPRFLIVVSPVLALLFAQLATDRYRAVLLLIVAAAVTVVTLHRLDGWYRATRPSDPPVAPRDFRPLIGTLDRLGLDRVYADYWIAYRLDFDSRERIIAVETPYPSTDLTFRGAVAVPPGGHVRRQEYREAVEVAPRSGFVYFRRNVAMWPFIPELVAHGYRRVLVGPFVVFAPPQT
jgi:hypothetical protein